MNQTNQGNQNYINSQNSNNSNNIYQGQIDMMNTLGQGNKGAIIKKTTSQNNENNNGQLNEENDKDYIETLQKKKEIGNLIYIMIDIEITNNKMNYPLHKASEEERYYQINLDWFNKYLENRQIQSLFNNNIIIETIKAVLKKGGNHSYKDILDKLKSFPEFDKETAKMYKKIKIDNTYSQIPIEIISENTYFYNNFIK